MCLLICLNKIKTIKRQGLTSNISSHKYFQLQLSDCALLYCFKLIFLKSNRIYKKYSINNLPKIAICDVQRYDSMYVRFKVKLCRCFQDKANWAFKVEHRVDHFWIIFVVFWCGFLLNITKFISIVLY